ncbi:SRPBCC domain-containing protein [Nocardia sp. NPDC059246]|uniref:SRPBCC domain-containing protein n=1 Tax=unclassified Nocardia TaxID=2637762 RepID=UPI00369060F5
MASGALPSVMTWHLAAADDGTEVTVTATDVPSGIDQADYEAGIASSLADLAAYVEADDGDAGCVGSAVATGGAATEGSDAGVTAGMLGMVDTCPDANFKPYVPDVVPSPFTFSPGPF